MFDWQLLLGIRSGTNGPEAWQTFSERFRACSSSHFAEDGFLYAKDDESIGQYAQIPRSTLEHSCSGAPWLSLAPPDPSLGSAVLFVGLDLWPPGREFTRALLKEIGYAAAGFFVRGETIFDSVRTFTFPLADALSTRSSGFADGDHFLRDHDGAMSRVRAIVADGLEQAGVVAEWWNADSHHNPIRFHAPADAAARLEGLEVRFPGFDLELFRSAAFERGVLDVCGAATRTNAT